MTLQRNKNMHQSPGMLSLPSVGNNNNNNNNNSNNKNHKKMSHFGILPSLPLPLPLTQNGTTNIGSPALSNHSPSVTGMSSVGIGGMGVGGIGVTPQTTIPTPIFPVIVDSQTGKTMLKTHKHTHTHTHKYNF